MRYRIRPPFQVIAAAMSLFDPNPWYPANDQTEPKRKKKKKSKNRDKVKAARKQNRSRKK